VNIQGVSGAVLAGGRSSRFGLDKALASWRGRTLLEHALDGLAGCAERFVVGGDAARYGFAGVPVHPDLEPHQGSLFGLARALEIAAQPRVAVTACDMPRLTGAYWAFLADLELADVVIPQNANGQLEPLAAIYAKACLSPVQNAIEESELRMTGWLERVSVRVVPWVDLESRFGSDVFRNVNTRADLEQAREDALE
jgi:molybdenum cofactor guanylyltransferase